MNSLPEDLDKGLLLELECPVCLERMVPPITMCENGHSICPQCKPKLNNCPSCSKPFLQVRNLALESLSRQVITEEGQRPPARFPNHVECPFTRISKDICPWKGPVTDIKDHVNYLHKNLNDTFEASGVFTIVLTGLSPTQHYRKAVFTADELFYIYSRIKDGSLYCAVFYVGEEEKCLNYTYRFVLTTDSDNRKISMSFPTRSIMENVEELLQSGDCVVLNYNTVLKFLNQNMYLECEFKINATEVAADISDGVNQPNLCAEPGVHSSQYGRTKWHRKYHKYDSLRSSASPDVHRSLFKPGRCVHGKRFKHCKICKYSTFLKSTPESSAASGTPSIQNIQPPIVSYCTPSVNLTEGASANCNFLPSAPAKANLYPDLMGNISPALSNDVKSCDEKLSSSGRSLLAVKTSCSLPTGNVLSKSSSDSFWKCPVCDRMAPTVPVSLPQPGSSSVPQSKRCKMCGLIKQEPSVGRSEKP